MVHGLGVALDDLREQEPDQRLQALLVARRHGDIKRGGFVRLHEVREAERTVRGGAGDHRIGENEEGVRKRRNHGVKFLIRTAQL